MNQAPILLVEDEPDIAFFFKHVLKKLEVPNPLHVSTDGQAALDYIEGAGEFADRTRHPLPALVLLDLKLPRVSGFDVLARVRAQPKHRSLIVIVLTSSSSDRDIAKAYALGANAYLVKPMGIEHLEATLRAIKDFWLNLNQPPPPESL